MVEIRALFRCIVLSIAVITLASCSGARLAASRDYVPRYEPMPRSINQTEEEYASLLAEASILTPAGHIFFLSNEGNKPVELSDVSVNFHGVEYTPLLLTEPVQVPAGGTIPLPMVITEGIKAACLIPASLVGNVQILGKSRPEVFAIGFAERMDAAHFREWRLAECDQSPSEPQSPAQAARNQ